mgnify:CR=1 FL=1
MKIALIGYGKMGKEIEKIALNRGHEIVSIIDINNQEDFESDAFKSADVAIEFTNPMVAYNNYMKAFKAGVKLVSGSTGWLEEHGEEVKRLCTEGGKTLFWSSNFSLGVAIFSAVNKYLAKIMNRFPAYDVTMSETHHIHKLDAPSGTAITLAEGILDNLDRKERWVKGTLQAPDGTISGFYRLCRQRTACQLHPRRGSSGYPQHPLRLRSRQHHHHPRRQKPPRVCLGSRIGRRVHRRQTRILRHERFISIFKRLKHYEKSNTRPMD